MSVASPANAGAGRMLPGFVVIEIASGSTGRPVSTAGCSRAA